MVTHTWRGIHSLTLSHSYYLTLSLTLFLAHSLLHIRRLKRTRKLPYSNILRHTQSHTHSLSLSSTLTHTHIHTHSLWLGLQFFFTTCTSIHMFVITDASKVTQIQFAYKNNISLLSFCFCLWIYFFDRSNLSVRFMEKLLEAYFPLPLICQYIFVKIFFHMVADF